MSSTSGFNEASPHVASDRTWIARIGDLFRPNPVLDEQQQSGRTAVFHATSFACGILLIVYLINAVLNGEWLLLPGGAFPFAFLLMLGHILCSLLIIRLGHSERMINIFACFILFLTLPLLQVNLDNSFAFSLFFAGWSRAVLKAHIARLWFVTLQIGCLYILFTGSLENFSLAVRFWMTAFFVFAMWDTLLTNPTWHARQRARAALAWFLTLGISVNMLLLGGIFLGHDEGSIVAGLLAISVLTLFWIFTKFIPMRMAGLIFGGLFGLLQGINLYLSQGLTLPFSVVYLFVALLVLSPRAFALFSLYTLAIHMAFLLHWASEVAPTVIIKFALAAFLMVLLTPFVFYKLLGLNLKSANSLLGEGVVDRAWLRSFGLRLLVALIFVPMPIFILHQGLSDSSALWLFVSGWPGYFWWVFLAIVGIVLVAILTQRQRQLVQLSELKHQALQSDRAQSELLATTNHDIRIPLNNLMATIDMVKQCKGLTAEVQKYIDIMDQSAEKLSRLMGNMIDLSVIEKGHLSIQAVPFDMVEMIRSRLDALQATAKEMAVELVFDEASSATGLVNGDALRIGQIVDNLVGNAIKFSQGGQVNVSAYSVSGGLEMVVSDTGIGMDETTIQRMFQRFEQADNSLTRNYQGLGLGLSICHELVDAMQGTIDVASALGKGTSVRVFLPLPPMSHNEPAPPIVTLLESTIDLSHLRLLVVEDDLVSRLVLSNLLDGQLRSIHIASSGHEALDVLAGSSVDVVLTDIGMPDMDGVALLQEIRRRGFTMPVIALTGNALSDDLKFYKAVGFDEILAKPIDNDRLLIALDRFAPPCEGSSA